MKYIGSGERKLLNILLSSEHPVGIRDLTDHLKRSKRMVYYYISNINDIFEGRGIEKINNNNEGFYLTDYQIKVIPSILNDIELIFSPGERAAYITAYLIYSNGNITIDDLTDYFSVTRNVIMSDLLFIKDELRKNQLILRSSKNRGYVVEGDVYRQRSVFQTNIRKLIKFTDYRNLTLFNIERINDRKDKLIEILNMLKIEIYETEIVLLAFVLSSTRINPNTYNLRALDLDFILGSLELGTVDKYFTELPHHERIYLAIQLVRYRLPGDSIQFAEDEGKFIKLATDLVNSFELLSCTLFESKDTLINSISMHLQLSFLQYNCGLSTTNPLLDEIKKKYSEVYNIAELCCERFKDRFPYPVMESEISFLTTHFAAYMDLETLNRDVLNVLLVCLNSTASSLLLKNEIESTYENIKVAGIIKPSQVQREFKSDIDFIISTIDNIDDNIPHIIVNPILTKKDRMSINNMLGLHGSKDFTYNLKPIYDIIKKNTDDKSSYNRIVKAIEKYVKPNDSDNHSEKQSLIAMLEQFPINVENNSSVSWKKAIMSGSMPLIENQYIDQCYIDKMIENIEEFGPHIVISDTTAIAHAQPKDGAKHLGLTLTVFPHKLRIINKTVQMLYVLSTPNQNDHLGILNDILKIESDEKLLSEIVSISNSSEGLELLTNFFN